MKTEEVIFTIQVGHAKSGAIFFDDVHPLNLSSAPDLDPVVHSNKICPYILNIWAVVYAPLSKKKGDIKWMSNGFIFYVNQ